MEHFTPPLIATTTGALEVRLAATLSTKWPGQKAARHFSDTAGLLRRAIAPMPMSACALPMDDAFAG